MYPVFSYGFFTRDKTEANLNYKCEKTTFKNMKHEYVNLWINLGLNAEGQK